MTMNAPFQPGVVNLTLGSLAPTADAFGRLLIIVPKATNSLNTSRTLSIPTYAAAVAARGSGYISAATLTDIAVVFAQTNVPAQGVLLGNVDLVGSETYAEALVAITLVDPVFFLVKIASRTSADIQDVFETVEWMNDRTAAAANSVPFKRCFFVAQSADTGLLTGTFPSGLNNYVGAEWSNLSFHPTDSENLDTAHQCRLSVDLATASPGWIGWTVKNVAAYPTSSLSTTQEGFARTNHVDLLQLTTTTTGPALVCGLGENGAGRQVPEVVTGAWLATTMEVEINTLFVNLALANQQLTLTKEGQQAVASTLQSVVNTAISAGAVRATDDDGNTGYTITAIPITDADKVAKQMRFEVAVLTPIGATAIVIGLSTSTTSVV